jgi:hypothetical protein
MNCIKDGKYTGDSCFGCKVYAVECEIRDKVYRNRWIPVSERLPEENTDVLLQFSNKTMVVGFCYTDDYVKELRWQSNDDANSCTDIWDKPIAWQPLPTPYKEEL